MPDRPDPTRLEQLVCARLACTGKVTSRSDLKKALKTPAHGLALFDDPLDAALDALVARGEADRQRGSFVITEAGRAAAQAWLGVKRLAPKWQTVLGKAIPARLLGLNPAPAGSPGQWVLATVINQAYGLDAAPTLAGARNALVRHRVLELLGIDEAALSPAAKAPGGKYAALLITSLLDAPTSRVTPDQGLAAVAERVLDSSSPPKEAIVQRWLAGLDPVPKASDSVSPAPASSPPPDTKTLPPPAPAATPAATAPLPAGQTPPAALPPVDPDDLPGFATRVLDATRACTTGRPLNPDHVLINHVWRTLQSRGAATGLDEPTFKRMLASAAHSGLVRLVHADSMHRLDPLDVREAATAFGSYTVHFVCIETT